LAPDRNSSGVAQAVQEVSEKAQLLIREEIALAKAELTDKLTKLVKGIAVGLVAGIFALLALLYFLDALAWGVWELIDGEENIWMGFLIVGVLLLLLGGVAGYLAAKFVKRGTPPTPKMAIEEAQLIKQTISSSSAPAKKSPEVRR